MRECLWPAVRVGDCCEVLDHRRVPLNAEERAQIPGDVPYYGANGVQGYISKHLFDEPLILLAEDGGYFDEHETRPIAYRISGKSWVNNHAHILRVMPGTERCQDFIFYALEHKDITPFIKGGTRAKLNQAELRDVEIPDPCPRIQRRIAEILSTVDETIDQTEALIAKTQQIKAGLMHDLFTRGVTADGQLRPPREEAPQLYKESPLGWIPNEWDWDRAGNIASSIVPGRNKPSLDGGPFPWVTITDIQESNVSSSREGLSVSEIALSAAGGRTVPAGAVIMSCVGEFGISAIAGREIVINQQLHGFIPSDRVHPEWLMHTLRMRKPFLERIATQTTIKYINKAGCDSVLVPLPSPHEQLLMVERLSSAEIAMQCEKAALKKLAATKVGLMHALLTGRVLVSVESQPEPKEVAAGA